MKSEIQLSFALTNASTIGNAADMKKTSLRRKNDRLRTRLKTDVATLLRVLEEYPPDTSIKIVANSLMAKLLQAELHKSGEVHDPVRRKK